MSKSDPLTQHDARSSPPDTNTRSDPHGSSTAGDARGVSEKSASLKLISTTGPRLGYRPGRRIADLYHDAENEPFWNLQFCGVEFVAQPLFNPTALTNSDGEASCPSCRSTVSFDQPEFLAQFKRATVQRLNRQTGDEVVCTQCHHASVVDAWKVVPPLAFGNLAIRFWNWPPFYMTQWSLSVPSVVREYSGHTIVESFGHL